MTKRRGREIERRKAMDGGEIDRRLFVRRTAAAGVLVLGGLGTPTFAQTRPRAREVGGMSTFKSPMITVACEV